MKKIEVTKIVYPLEAGKRVYVVGGIERSKQEHEQFMQGVVYATRAKLGVVENTVIHSPHA